MFRENVFVFSVFDILESSFLCFLRLIVIKTNNITQNRRTKHPPTTDAMIVGPAKKVMSRTDRNTIIYR